MRLTAYFVAGCLVLAILKVSLQVVLATGLIVLIWLAVTRPFETAAWLAILIGYGTLKVYPLQGIVALGVLTALILIKRRNSKS
ncbi:hypothetical protein [Altererythrobacter sp. Root672]|uniref:hypothetical protein n=1 Tax=Altererythrobacter sp. Root672 TaxID=1736584 RepID=UPI0006F88841|nr:hypothetical protein [Altererythrobacter sp. Root672]KRA82549.1 hypothetical protein ASD76_00070 [Altererythrobacter sp. Root672]